MNKLSINININGKGQAEIDTIELENSEGAEIIDFKEEEEDEYEEDEAGHLWDDEAYLLAAEHFLSSWPDSWTAETLVKNLLMLGPEPDIEEQMKIKIWLPVMQYCINQKFSPFVYVEEQIACLADTLIRYKKS